MTAGEGKGRRGGEGNVESVRSVRHRSDRRWRKIQRL
jgi:hypothetical protein